MPRPIIYLDNAASTPIDPAVAAAMQACLDAPEGAANPTSTHALGRAAAERIERARAQLASLIGAQAQEIFFTSGATEADNLALLGIARANADRGRHIVTSRIEHKAVLDPLHALEREGFQVTYLSPDGAGRISAEAVGAVLRPETLLVSLMHVNNEIGVIQDIAAVGALCRARGIPLHSDAAQSLGRIAIDVRELPVDLLSFSAHKLHGPKGIGALYVRQSVRPLLRPVSFGGGQERGLRPGTPATHQIVGFGAACELAVRLLEHELVRTARLRARLLEGLLPLGGVHENGAGAPRVPQILNLSFEDVEGESLVGALEDLAVSRGSACSSGSGDASAVLRALGRSTRLAESSLRLSVGRFTTEQEVEQAVALIRDAVGRLRAAGPRAERWGGSVPIPDAAGQVLRGEAGAPESEAWVRFHLLVAGDFVKDARCQAFGCPHTLAAAAWVSAQLPGRARGQLSPSGALEWARTLGTPPEKLGRLLVIEDALRATLQQWGGRS